MIAEGEDQRGVESKALAKCMRKISDGYSDITQELKQ